MNDKKIGNIILEGAITAEDSVIIDGSNRKRVEAEGTLQDMDTENRNRRIYESSDLVPEVKGPRIRELLKAKSLKAELGHPLSDDLIRQQTIDPKLVCCRFNDIWVDGKYIKARFQGTNNQYGEEFDMNLRDGEKPAFSLRALGSIENRNGKAYVKNIKIITWDCVIYPSHRCAYTDKIISESAVLPNGETKIYENQIIGPENDPGRIITLTESDARTVINRLQRESANISTILETFEGLTDNISCINENTIILSTRYGEQIHVNLESYIDNAVMDYVFKL